MKQIRNVALALTGVWTLLVLHTSCNKTETLNTASLGEYYPLQSGKYQVYQLDSLVYLSFGTRDTTISYQVKYLTDQPFTDNLGRNAWRIFRFIRKDSTQPWTPDASFAAVNTGNTLEFVENNLRYLKLHAPLSLGFSWKGNRYIDTYSASSLLKYLDNWDYTYSEVDQPGSSGLLSFDSTLTVEQRDEIIGFPEDPNSYSEVNLSREKYAKGVGLIYRTFFHSEYQPGNGGYFADGSYGITLTLLEHN